MQEKRPNIVLGYRSDVHGEPIQTLIGPTGKERSIVFNLNSGETTFITSRDLNISPEPFLPCNDSINKKIFSNMRKRPDIYVKFYNILNNKIPR